MDNKNMLIQGRVYNGVVILENGAALPEGTQVTVSCEVVQASKKLVKRKRVQFPLVHSEHPGTLHLTGERIAEILDEEDASPRH